MPPCGVLGGMNPPLRRRGQQQVAQTPEVGVCGLSYHGSGDEPQTGKARSALPELQEPLTPGPSPAKGRGESRLELIALSPFWNSLPSPRCGRGWRAAPGEGTPALPDCGPMVLSPHCKFDCVRFTAQAVTVPPVSQLALDKVVKYRLDAWADALVLSITMPLVPPVSEAAKQVTGVRALQLLAGNTLLGVPVMLKESTQPPVKLA